MTLPVNINLPQPEDYQANENQFVEDLISKLEDMYGNVVENVNGTYRNEAEVDGSQWIPTLQGSTPGTFTYTNQTGWCLRQGIMTDIWGKISWSSTTAAGNLYVELPYRCTKSNNSPFIGTCITSVFAYPSGNNVVINAFSDSYLGYIYTWGPGVSKTNLGVPSNGSIEFHLRYIGISDE